MNGSANLLTVDLEEWFVAEALQSLCSYEDWESLPSTLVANSRRLLGLLQRYNVLATWFVVGWCADRHPDLVREIADRGHEIACHSYGHRRVNQMEPEQFRQDTRRAVDAIVRATGVRPRGYRAPSWSIDARIPWAFEILSELGFEYDSSVFPIKHDLYGMPEGPRQIFRMKLDNGRFLYEVPATTYRFLGKNHPIAGGGYLRHSPYWYSRSIIRGLNRRDQPAVVYVHPWEIDPHPPRIEGLSLVQRLRTYGSTSILAVKLEKLLREFDFMTVSRYIRERRHQSIGFQ